MMWLWKWVHRKEPVSKPGKYERDGVEIEISEGGFPDSKELEDKLP